MKWSNPATALPQGAVAALLACSALLLAAEPVAAHHAFAAEFDVKRPIKLRGTVVKVEWINPHSWIQIEVKGADGKSVTWMIEGGSPTPCSVSDSTKRRCRAAVRSWSRDFRRRTVRTRVLAS
jgi:hypothetical protein